MSTDIYFIGCADIGDCLLRHAHTRCSTEAGKLYVSLPYQNL